MIDVLLLVSIVFFFLLLFFLGFSLFYISPVSFPESDTLFIRKLLYLGAGLGFLVFLIILFDVLHIPLDYRIFFIVSLFCPLHFVVFHWNSFISSLKNTFLFSSYSKKEVLLGVVVIATGILFYTFLTGAFAYPYLEDDDPWEHAVAVKYIAEEKTYYQASGESISHYLEPYPPTYDAILVLAYQINESVFLTLKVFNVILIALGILFFFVFARELFGLEIATVSTIVLVALPSWMSHFIWSHTLALVLFFPALTLAVRGFSDQRYIIPAIILIAAEMVTHPFVAVLFGVFYVILVFWQFGFTFVSLKNKAFTTMNSFTHSFLIGLFGFALSFLYWGQQLARHGLETILYSHTGGFGGVAQVGEAQTVIEQYINPAYTLSDFLIAPLITKIDQPTGFGVVVFVLGICAVVYLLWNWKNYFVLEKYELVVVVWFVLTFIGLFGGHLPLSILTHRFWAYVSIPLSLLVGVFVVALFEKIHSRVVAVVLALVLFFGIFGIPFFGEFNLYTSWYPKYIVETSQWPPGVAWSSVQELEGYMWMHEHLVDSHVLSLCKEEKFLIGFDIETAFPNEKMNHFRENLAMKTLGDIVLQSVGYDAVSLEYSCVKKGYLTEEQLNSFANNLASQFSVLFMNDEIVVYDVD